MMPQFEDRGFAKPSPQPPLRAPACASGAGVQPHTRQWRVSSVSSPRREGAQGYSARPRNSSLMLVLERVFASTCLTITAQYSECEPSFAGSWPDTTTLYGGTDP